MRTEDNVVLRNHPDPDSDFFPWIRIVSFLIVGVLNMIFKTLNPNCDFKYYNPRLLSKRQVFCTHKNFTGHWKTLLFKETYVGLNVFQKLVADPAHCPDLVDTPFPSHLPIG